jgi:ABC-2 type transport system permease protein
MAKPISRSSILTSKILAALTNVVIFNTVTYITVFIVYKKYSFDKDIIMLMIGMLLVQLLFMLIGICFAAISKKAKKSGGIITSIILLCFTISMLIDLSDKFNILKIITPFKYFEAKDLIIKNSINIGYVILTLILAIGMLFITYSRYNKRDLSL